jgi:repressor of nif and glnA expression
MIGHETQEVERKIVSILKTLNDSQEPVGARLIAQRLKDYGVELGERTVRYHLKLMDEQGLTQLIGREGRVITESGVEELKSALVGDKVGFAISRIELLAFRTNFDLDKRTGLVPVNVSFFPKEEFGRALKIMKLAFSGGICVSDLVAVAQEGKVIGELIVPEGKAALATVCSIVMNGALLKVGVPMSSKFSGILQVKNYEPLRFVELIQYTGCSLDPSEVFIRAGMTSVIQVASKGEGKILATYREIPALCQPMAEEVVFKLNAARLKPLLLIGKTSETVCGISVELNRIGVILYNGLNPVAAAKEAGIEAENHGMSTVIEYQKLIKFEELVK